VEFCSERSLKNVGECQVRIAKWMRSPTFAASSRARTTTAHLGYLLRPAAPPPPPPATLVPTEDPPRPAPPQRPPVAFVYTQYWTWRTPSAGRFHRIVCERVQLGSIPTRERFVVPLPDFLVVEAREGGAVG